MSARRLLLAAAAASLLAATALTTIGCGGPRAASAPPPPPLHLRPATDLAPAAALVWLVDAHPRDLFANPELAAAVAGLFSEEQLTSFAKRHGGVDLRQLDELTIASYPETTLFLALGVLDPARVESAFTSRARVLDGRGLDRQAGPLGSITRLWGTVNEQREQLAIFGHEAAGLEIGRFGPLRAAEAFAQGKLRRAQPALRSQPLARASDLFAGAPLRLFAPGPFDGDYAHALGGLLGASTAAAVAVDPLEGGASLRVRIALLGGWTRDDASPAGARLAAAVNTVMASSIGKLCGLDDPISAPRTALVDDALIAEFAVRSAPLFRGLRAATGAGVDEIMRY